MSKSVIIQRGGVDETWNGIDVIQTQSSGSGRVDWVPEDTTATADKYINKNGTYDPEDEGLYGYSKVRVNVAGDSITGKGKDGNTYTISTDGMGNIIETKVPSSIRVTTPPTRTDYVKGDKIDFTGIVVTAYDAEGNSMGEVPFNELIFPVTIADAGDNSEWTNGAGVNALLAVCTTEAIWRFIVLGQWQESMEGYVYDAVLGHDKYGKKCTILKSQAGATYLTQYDGIIYGANAWGNAQANTASDNEEETNYGWHLTGSRGNVLTDRFAAIPTAQEWLENTPASSVDPSSVGITDLYAAQTIPVQWTRPGDYGMLETAFAITVGDATGGGGQAVDTGAGRD